jgi:hypothetical protein
VAVACHADFQTHRPVHTQLSTCTAMHAIWSISKQLVMCMFLSLLQASLTACFP